MNNSVFIMYLEEESTAQEHDFCDQEATVDHAVLLCLRY